MEDLDPRTVDEFLVGTARQFSPSWSARLYGRYREGSHFWEDTNNNARVAFNPPAGIPRELYIPDLTARLAQIGSGSTYVIAELDGAYTKFYEATLESEWRDAKTFVRGSYTWSHYYGNFDQDNTTGLNNDMNIFIGSSNIADGAGPPALGQQGRRPARRPPAPVEGVRLPHAGLEGDRGRVLRLPVRPAVGGAELRAVPRLTTSTSDTNRNAEPAGSRRTDSHWQLDLNYTQNFRLGGRLNLQVVADVFNVFDKQTGYNIRAPRAQLGLRHAAELLRPAPAAGRGALAVLAAGTAASLRDQRAGGRIRPLTRRARSAPPGRAPAAARSPARA